MKIMGTDGQHYDVASNSKANTAVTLGAIGTGLAILGNNNNGCGGGLLSGIFGGNGKNGDCYVNKTELGLSQRVASLEAEKYTDMIARQEADRIFTESRRQDDKIAAVIKDTTGALIEIGNAVSGQAKEIACMQVEIARNREEAKTYTDTRVNQEAELRKAADQNILAYTNAELAKKISGTLTLPESEINFTGCQPVLCNTRCLGTPSNPVNVELVIAQAVQAAMAATVK